MCLLVEVRHVLLSKHVIPKLECKVLYLAHLGRIKKQTS